MGQIIGGPAAAAGASSVSAGAASSSPDGITGSLKPDDPEALAVTAGARAVDGARIGAPAFGITAAGLPLLIHSKGG